MVIGGLTSKEAVAAMQAAVEGFCKQIGDLVSSFVQGLATWFILSFQQGWRIVTDPRLWLQR